MQSVLILDEQSILRVRIDRVAQPAGELRLHRNPHAIDERNRVALARVGAANQCVYGAAEVDSNVIAWICTGAKGMSPRSISADEIALNHQPGGIAACGRG